MGCSGTKINPTYEKEIEDSPHFKHMFVNRNNIKVTKVLLDKFMVLFGWPGKLA